MGNCCTFDSLWWSTKTPSCYFSQNHSSLLWRISKPKFLLIVDASQNISGPITLDTKYDWLLAMLNSQKGSMKLDSASEMLDGWGLLETFSLKFAYTLNCRNLFSLFSTEIFLVIDIYFKQSKGCKVWIAHKNPLGNGAVVSRTSEFLW